MRLTFLLLTILLVVSSSATSSARSPTGWSPVILPSGPYRQKIQSTPIDRRPGRLFHVYGNTIRMFRLADEGVPIRPVRQIVIGTPDVRSDVIGER